jgi:hypothetical protein
MKAISLLFIFLCYCSYNYAQTTEDYAVELSAAVQESPAQITLRWKPRSIDAPEYHIWKKAKKDTSWGTEIAILPAADSVYTDASVVVDSAYEYQVEAIGSWLTSTGYIYAGIKAPAIHSRGTLVLLVDSTFSDSCADRITRLMRDIRGDGWQVIRHDFSRSVPCTAIKSVIISDRATNPDVKAVLLLGHIAVPYSGDYTEDHTNHIGAYPADVYYSCLDGVFTDVSAYDVSSDHLPNHNVPGDGKFDQSTIPAPASLQVSRIDFNNMYYFHQTEVQLMNSYLDRDHSYKMDSLGIRHRALINDNFGPFAGEAFASSAWRNFSTSVGRDSEYVIPFVPSLADSSFQWAYGCGGGSFVSAAGVGTTSDFVSNPVNGIFVLLFGSYFGDWDADNDFLRAPLCASTPALTSCWAGRPHWFFHHMPLGENIGYSAWLAQNNAGLYVPQTTYAQDMHIALMGDLTLRTDYIQPASGLVIRPVTGAGATISWRASADAAVLGYYVYRSDAEFGNYQRISSLVTGTSFSDRAGTSGLKYYMVRPVKLQSTPSGKYYNPGIGIVDSATVSFPHTLLKNNVRQELDLSVFPNPARNYLGVALKSPMAAMATINIIDEQGKVFNTYTWQVSAGNNSYKLNVSGLPAGVYALTIMAGDKMVVKKWVKLQ